MIRRALISVSDKTNLLEFAQTLVSHQIEILATGGTATLLMQHNIPVTEVSAYTGFPEILDGRVKTLHPKILGGILARRGIDDTTLATHDINPIDLVIVNLYPFEANKTIETIDIGGPTLIRSAAKNYADVTVVVDPTDYNTILDALTKHSDTYLTLRHQLAQKAFAHTARYDSIIAAHFAASDELPLVFHPYYEQTIALRYGENPQQKAAFYREKSPSHAPNGTLGNAELLQGKPLSYNNMVDADAALACAQALDPTIPGCVIVKHATPCGVAHATSLQDAYEKAFSTDPSSAFGGILAFNRPLDKKTADIITAQQFVEVIIAPHVSADAQQVLATKKNLRVLQAGDFAPRDHNYCLRSVSGGLLIQTPDQYLLQPHDYRIVSKRQPTAAELQELYFAWRVVQFTKSNAIVYTNNHMTLGIGAGQTSRVFSAKIAALKAQDAGFSLQGATMASDAFFPFADSIEFAAAAGITAVIHPGGSIRDEEVIAKADQLGLAMVITDVRHFLH